MIIDLRVYRYHHSLAVLGNIVTGMVRGIMVSFAKWLDRIGLLASRCSECGERLDELHVERENKYNHLFNQLWSARYSGDSARPRVRSTSADWPAPRPRSPIPPLMRASLSPHANTYPLQRLVQLHTLIRPITLRPQHHLSTPRLSPKIDGMNLSHPTQSNERRSGKASDSAQGGNSSVMNTRLQPRVRSHSESENKQLKDLRADTDASSTGKRASQSSQREWLWRRLAQPLNSSPACPEKEVWAPGDEQQDDVGKRVTARVGHSLLTFDRDALLAEFGLAPENPRT